MEPLLGGIEAGGTKFVCALGTGPGDLRAETTFPTTTPAETIGRAVGFFRQGMQEHGPLSALGIGSFGPIGLQPDAPDYGRITSTPKPSWARTPILHEISQALKIPVVFDTDVNAAAVGEGRWGAAQGLSQYAYLTVGTGIGGGLVVDGRPIHGLVHPEVGHMRIARPAHDREFAGSCPFHGDCLEGLASGTALRARWRVSAAGLPESHEAWVLEAEYLAQALTSLICILSPQRIILGGGVMKQAQLFPMIRKRVQELLNGYVQAESVLNNIEEMIVPPARGGRAGVLGAMALTQLS